jgi:hypothetical protein
MSTTDSQQRTSARRGPTTSAAAVSQSPREQFIPLRKADLVESLASSPDLSESDSLSFRRLCRLLQALFHREYQSSLEDLQNAYAPFDPDADTRPQRELSDAELTERQQTLFERFGWLLQRGNFLKLAQSDIDRALSDSSQWGLNLAIDLRIFERLEIYCRGDSLGIRYRRRLINRLRTEAIEVPIYQRLVVIFRLRPDCKFSKYLDTRDIHIKLFKEIPKLDLEMLLPGTQVKMSLVDRAKILLPTLSGISITIWKLVQGAIFAAAVGFYGVLALLGLVGGTIGYGVRSFFGYLNTKQKYQLNLTQSLYYQNLDNNAGVIYRLLDEAEEQDNREAILAYFYLWRHGLPGGSSVAELDGQIEAFLKIHTKSDVDFEVSDALAKLERLGIVAPASDGKIKALEISEALGCLERRWAILPS